MTEISLFETQRPQAKFVNEAPLEARLWLPILFRGLVHLAAILYADGEAFNCYPGKGRLGDFNGHSCVDFLCGLAFPR